MDKNHTLGLSLYSLSSVAQLLGIDTSHVEMFTLINLLIISLFLLPKLTGLHQLVPTNILGPLPIAEDTGHSCPETLHSCCFLLVPRYDRKAPLSFPMSPFPLGTRKSHLYLPSTNYPLPRPWPSLLTSQEPMGNKTLGTEPPLKAGCLFPWCLTEGQGRRTREQHCP